MHIVVLIFFALCLSFSGQVRAQHASIDSLESLVKSLPSDTNKVWFLNNLVNTLREKDNNRAMMYALQSRDLAEVLGYKKGLSLALENLGWILYRKGEYSKSFDVSARALKLNEEMNDRRAVARCLINIAAIHFEQKQYEQSIKHFRDSYQIAVGFGDKVTMARCLNNIAFGFCELNLPDSSLKYSMNALAISQQIGDKYLAGFAMRTLGDVYFTRKEYDAALENFNECLKIARADGNTFLKVSTLHRLGRIYTAMGYPDRAISFLKENIEVAELFGYKEELERTYKLISEIYASRKDIAQAYYYQSKYIVIHDSLSGQRQDEKMTLMQSQLNAEIKEAQIDLLTKEAELNEKELRSQKLWLYFSISCLTLLMLLAFVLFYNNRYNSRAKRELQQKNEAIHSQTEQLKNLNATKDKLFSIISHDLRSPLASLKALMELVGTPGLTHDEFVNITRILKRNLDSVHYDLDNLLMWAQTQLKGLQAAPETLELKRLVDEKVMLFREAANSKRVTISNEIKPGTLVFADRNHIGLVLRNLIANAIKFNQPGGHIAISSVPAGNDHEVSISDSGVGISMEDLGKLFNAETHFTRPGTNKERGVGIGLLITKEFLDNNNGSIRVASELGKGTTFTFSLKASSESIMV